MAEISIGAAAFSGVRFIVARPGLVLGWIGVRIVLGLAVGLGLSCAFMFQLYMTPPGGHQIVGLWPVGVIVLVVVLISESIFITAANRSMANSRPDALLYFRLSPAEARQFIITTIFAIWLIAVMAICIITPIALLDALKFTKTESTRNTLIWISFLFITPITMTITCARTFTISPQVYVRRKFELLSTWKNSRNQYWPIFCGMIIFTISIVLFASIVTLLDRNLNAIPGTNNDFLVMMGVRAKFSGRWIGIFYYLTPAHIYADILRAIFGGICLPLWLAPSVSIYRSLTAGADAMGDSGESVADVFA